MTRNLYDPKCEEIAEHFLPSGVRPELVKELSQFLQDAIEEWLSDKADEIARQLKKLPQ